MSAAMSTPHRPRAAPAQRAAASTAGSPHPVLQRPRVQRVLYPLLVGVVLLALWQALVTGARGAALPRALAAAAWSQTLVTDWAPLGGSLLVTLKITRAGVRASPRCVGVLISFLFVQSRGSRPRCSPTPCCCR